MDRSSDFDKLLGLGFEFSAQPTPVPASLKPSRRIPLLVLVISRGRGKKMEWRGIHLLSWAIRDVKNMDLLVKISEGKDIPDRPMVRIEPALDRAIDLSLGINLIEQNKGRVFQLTDKGKRLSVEIDLADVFEHEKEQLGRLKKSLTQAQISSFLEWRSK